MRATWYIVGELVGIESHSQELNMLNFYKNMFGSHLVVTQQQCLTLRLCFGQSFFKSIEAYEVVMQFFISWSRKWAPIAEALGFFVLASNLTTALQIAGMFNLLHLLGICRISPTCFPHL